MCVLCMLKNVNLLKCLKCSEHFARLSDINVLTCFFIFDQQIPFSSKNSNFLDFGKQLWKIIIQQNLDPCLEPCS